MTDDLRLRMVRFVPRLRRFAYVLTGDTDRGDDLVQDTCARALSRLDQFQPGTAFESWMFRIAQTQWLDRLRAEKTRGQMLDLDAVDDIAGEDGRAVVESRLTFAKVSEGIARLPPEQRVLLALIAVDGRSYKEAAEILSIPVGTVMSRLSRARLSLSRCAEGSEPKARASRSGGGL